MIEPIMYVGIGFLVAGLLFLGIIPLVHGRAVRLTVRRLEASTPMSMGEIQADKDQLRAEFAMSTRRLEMSVEQMKAKTTSQLAEIGKKSEAIGRLKLELGEKTAALLALEAKEKQLNDDLRTTEAERAAKASALEEAERQLAATAAELAKVTDSFHASSTTTDSQRVELVALRTQSEVLTGQIESYERETKDLHERIARDTIEAESVRQQLTEERGQTKTLTERIAELDGQIAAQTTEAETLDRRIKDLLSRIEQQARSLAEREQAAELLRIQAAAAEKNESDVRAELADTEHRRRNTIESLRAEKSQLEEQLRQSQNERVKLQREVEMIKRDAETTWAAERMENAVMRERINDVAAEVARLTSVLEGPASPVDAILAADMNRPHLPNNGAFANGDGSKGTLADRIRALQSRTSRLPQASGV
jgi:chromosome segregation ATPase